MAEDDGKQAVDESPENDEPQFKSLDDVVKFFRGEMDELKKLAKTDKKTRSTKDDFKLYHEQTESRLDRMNEKLTGIETLAEGFLEKFKNRQDNTRSFFEQAWDFLFKP